MKRQKHQLLVLWKSCETYKVNPQAIGPAYSIGEHLAGMLAIGPFYYYTINPSDYSLCHFSNAMAALHGINELPDSIHDIIDLIHPEDLDFVIAAEQESLKKITQIGIQHQLNLKTSYCFRMLVADGTYHLFHHQAVILANDDRGRLISALHIHTDMQHITQVNNKRVLIKGIGKRNDYCEINLSNKFLTQREVEVLGYLAQGLSSEEIGNKLFISKLTVQVHRRNLLKKTQTSNSSSLIKKCAEMSLLALKCALLPISLYPGLI
jgi:DNA-binding CsgD family transcriptional regulator